jgi:hypothetical protein
MNSAPAAGHDRACSVYGYTVGSLPVLEHAPQRYHYRLCQSESRHKGLNHALTKRFVAKMTRLADAREVLRCRDAWSILASAKGKRTQHELQKFSGGGIGGHYGWCSARARRASDRGRSQPRPSPRPCAGVHRAATVAAARAPSHGKACPDPAAPRRSTGRSRRVAMRAQPRFSAPWTPEQVRGDDEGASDGRGPVQLA